MLPRLLTDIIDDSNLRTIAGAKGEELACLYRTAEQVSGFRLLPTIAVPPAGKRVTQSRKRIRRLLEEELGLGSPIKAYIVRSSSYDEQPGKNTSIPIVYDARFVSPNDAQHKFLNGLWQAMNDVRVRENMPVLIQPLEAVFEDGHFGAGNFSFVVHSHSRRSPDDYAEIVFAKGLANNCVDGNQSDWAIIRKRECMGWVDKRAEQYWILKG